MSQEHYEQFAEVLTKPHYRKLSQQRFSAGCNNHTFSLCIWKGGDYIQYSVKAFDNLQRTILKCRFCMLLINCKQEHIKDIKRTVCTRRSHANTFRKLVFQKSHFCSTIMTKIVQLSQYLKRKIIRDILGWCVCSSCLCTILPQAEEQAMAKTCLK